MKKMYVTVILLALCSIAFVWRTLGVRPKGIPSSAVLVNGNYIDCTSRNLPPQHPCNVYNGSTGQELESQPVTERIKSLASVHGGSPTDCGRTSTRNPDHRVSECAQAAFRNHQPFYLQYEYPMVMFPLAYGLAGDGNGNVSEVVYSGRKFPGVAPTRTTQVFDQNHTRVTGCVRPISLGDTEDGLLGCITPVNEKESAAAAEQKPIETTICAIAENPAAFNNKMVRIRGHVSGNFEYSILDWEGCTDSAWFAYASDDDSPPGLVAYVPGGAMPGAEDSEGKRILPVPVKLVHNASFDRFEKLMNAKVAADARPEKSDSDNPVFHQVTATFVGRIDGVSHEIHALHRKRSPGDRSDFTGFGQMGLFDVQFVMQSVEDDAALDQKTKR